jgi:dTDP-glucose pyrophosphorylase
MRVVVPMAGLGSRFTKYGFKNNKYLLPVDSKLTPMIIKAIETLGFPNAEYLFIIRKEQESELCKLPGKIVVLDTLTDGPATTVKMGIDMAGPHSGPLIVANSDQLMDWDGITFLKKAEDYDGFVLTYTPDYDIVLGHEDKNSYIKKDDNGKAIQLSEKVVLSEEALVGIHYYRNTDIFMDAYEYMKTQDIRAPNGEFYISNTYQALVDTGKSVGSHLLGQDEKYWPVGEPLDYFKYIQLNEYLIDGIDIKNFSFDPFPVNYISSPGTYKVNGLVVCTNGPSIFKITNRDGLLVVSQGEGFCVVDVLNNLEGESSLKNFTRGWFVGKFEPSLARTEFEVGICVHHKTENNYDFHYHKEVEEFNILISGSMILNGNKLVGGQYFNIKPGQIACCVYLEESMVLCVKSSCGVNDKFTI